MMFTLTEEPIDVEKGKAALLQKRAGALVDFEGRVRDRNQGREVTRLDYEGAADLAANEFAKIEQEVREAFDILDVHCVHRTGVLEIGDVAVWIGVVAEHRDAAFDACRRTIDELKKRLPIWKKEHYTDGDSGWLHAP